MYDMRKNYQFYKCVYFYYLCEPLENAINKNDFHTIQKSITNMLLRIFTFKYYFSQKYINNKAY